MSVSIVPASITIRVVRPLPYPEKLHLTSRNVEQPPNDHLASYTKTSSWNHGQFQTLFPLEYLRSSRLSRFFKPAICSPKKKTPKPMSSVTAAPSARLEALMFHIHNQLNADRQKCLGKLFIRIFQGFGCLCPSGDVDWQMITNCPGKLFWLDWHAEKKYYITLEETDTVRGLPSTAENEHYYWLLFD